MSRTAAVFEDQSSLFQDLEVLRYRRSAHRHLASQFPYGQWLAAQRVEQRTTGRVREDGKHGKVPGYRLLSVSHN
jgi:hypothetical protein